MLVTATIRITGASHECATSDTTGITVIADLAS